MSQMRGDEVAPLTALDHKILAAILRRYAKETRAFPFAKLAKPATQGRHFFNGTHLASWTCDCDDCFEGDAHDPDQEDCASLAKFKKQTRKGTTKGARSHLVFTLREMDLPSARTMLYSAEDLAQHTPKVDVRSPRQRKKDKRERQKQRSVLVKTKQKDQAPI